MAKLNLIKVVKEDTYTDKKGNEKRKSFYALETENGNVIVISPVYKDGYAQLDLLADKKFPKKKEE